jgi:hypothetical protein
MDESVWDDARRAGETVFGSTALLMRNAALEIPADRPSPPVGGEAPFELDLTLVEVCGVDELFSSLGTVDVDDAQLEAAVRQIPDLIAEKLAAAFKPPEHKPSRLCVGTKPRRV